MIKVYLLVLGIWLTHYINAQHINPSQNKIYRFNEVMLIELYMSNTDKENLLDNSDLFSDSYFPTTIHIKNSKIDTTLRNVGVRIRGNTSRYKDKKSLKISFTAFDGEKFYNHKKFNLKAETNDPSLLRDYVSLHLYRNYGVPAARAHFVQLHINGEYMGVYLNVEQIDDEFVDRRFADNEAGNLYKCLNPASLEDNADLDNNDTYILKTNKNANDRSRLKELASVINNPSSPDFANNLEDIFNVDNYLKQLATEALIGHWDGYTRNSNNYYLYEDTISQKTQFIPYDLDNTWGILWGGSEWTNESISNWHKAEWEFTPLSTNLLNIAAYYDIYSRHAATQIDNFFNEDYIFPMLDSLNKLLSPLVEEDTYYTLDDGFTFSDFQNSLDQAWGEHVYFGLKEYLRNRIAKSETDLSSYDSYGKIGALDPFEALILTEVAEGHLSSMNSSLSKNNIRVYPNPVCNGVFTIQSLDNIFNSDIAVYDPTGREMPISISKNGMGSYHVIFKKTPYAGLYILKVGMQSSTLVVR